MNPPNGDALVDFGALGHRLRRAATVLGVLVGILAIADGLMNGFSPARLLAWLGLAVIGLVVIDTVFVAVSALRGADRAQRRGERLVSGDVGLLPPGLAGGRQGDDRDPSRQPPTSG